MVFGLMMEQAIGCEGKNSFFEAGKGNGLLVQFVDICPIKRESSCL
jgi:hypothetical protein